MGSGFRTFTAGEVLTASNVQNYLMDQSVMVFGGSAARSSAIGTANFEEGMISYLTDTDKVEAYNGTNWVSVAPASTQGLTLINTTSFSGVASIALPANTFSATYSHYKILFRAVGTALTGTGLFMKLRASGVDKSTGYYGNGNYMIYTSATINGSTTNNATQVQISTVEDAHSCFASIEVGAPYISGKTIILSQDYGSDDFNTLLRAIQGDTGGVFDSANFIAGSGNMSGTVSVYGYSV